MIVKYPTSPMFSTLSYNPTYAPTRTGVVVANSGSKTRLVISSSLGSSGWDKFGEPPWYDN